MVAPDMPALDRTYRRAAHRHGTQPIRRIGRDDNRLFAMWATRRQDASANRQGRTAGGDRSRWQRGPTSSAIERRLPTRSTSRAVSDRRNSSRIDCDQCRQRQRVLRRTPQIPPSRSHRRSRFDALAMEQQTRATRESSYTDSIIALIVSQAGGRHDPGAAKPQQALWNRRASYRRKMLRSRRKYVDAPDQFRCGAWAVRDPFDDRPQR